MLIMQHNAKTAPTGSISLQIVSSVAWQSVANCRAKQQNKTGKAKHKQNKEKGAKNKPEKKENKTKRAANQQKQAATKRTQEKDKQTKRQKKCKENQHQKGKNGEEQPNANARKGTNRETIEVTQHTHACPSTKQIFVWRSSLKTR